MNYVIIALALGAVYSLIAVGFALVFGILNFSNFSHGVIMAVGGFISFHLISKMNVHWILAILLTMICCGILGTAIEFLAFRKLRISGSPTIFLFVSSITVLMLIQNILTIKFKGNFFSFPNVLPVRSINAFGIQLPTTYLMIFIISIIVLILLNVFLKKTKMGLAISAASTDLKTSSLMGVNVNVVMTVVFVVSGMIGGLTGVFLGMTYTVNAQMGMMVLKGFIATVIGGMGSLSGALLGGFLLSTLEVILTLTIGSGLSSVGQFVLLILFLLIRPNGLLGRKSVDKV